MRCFKCGRDNREGRKFCAKCGGRLVRVCPKCGGSNEAGEDFCGECGASLAAPSVSHPYSPQPQGPPVRIEADNPSAALDGERKTVTALFADIKGSMELMEDLDPEEARAIVDPALKLMIEAVRHYDGYVVQSTGDGIFALFGAPVAHEDHPQRALYAALRMQEEMRRYAAKLREAGNLPIEARVGVNTGEVVVRSLATGEGQVEYTPIGHSTSLAARMQPLAPTGSIATADATRRLCEGYFTFKALGPTRVKGVTGAVNVYEVTGLGALRTHFQVSVRRGLTKFVGRQHELEQMKRALELAQAGHGGVVAAAGDPGVGKSRLLHEFKAMVGLDCKVLEAYSVSHGQASSYLPVIELLKDYFDIGPSDDERKRREKLNGKIVTLDRSLEDTLPYLFTLLSLNPGDDPLARMDPQIKRRRTQEAIKRVLLRESLNQPLMVIFEDLHWIDGETQGLLNILVDSIANARILLLVNYRPEYRHEWGSRTYYTQLRLDPLGRDSADKMLSSLLGNEAELGPLRRLIADKTESNPFFIEEIVQALFEDGSLVGNGVLKLTRPLTQVRVPATVQAVLASRIDRLPAEEKDLLHTLAVLGREFPLGLVQRVVLTPADELDRLLSRLQIGEFIYEQPGFPKVEYIFKHALTQEVAYNSIVAERRRLIHEQTASAMEALYGEQLEDHYRELAGHHLRGSDAAKAVRYTQLAAEQAVNRGAYPEAATLIDAALKLLEKLPEENQRLRAELALRTLESTLAFVMHGGASQERERPIKRMCELGEKLGERDQLLRGLIALAVLHFNRGESLLGQELAKRNLDLADTTQDARLLAEAHGYAGTLAFSCGNLQEALLHLDDTMRHASGDRLADKVSPFSGALFKVRSASIRALTLQLLGWPDEALKSAEQGLKDARDSRHLFSLAFVLTAPGSIFRCYRREPEIALVQAEEAIALSEENGFSDWLNWGQFTHGCALAELGQPAQGIAEMEAAVAGFRRRGGQPFHQYRIALIAQAYARTGRTGEALTMLHEALAHIEQTGERVDHAEILRLKGEVLLMHDRSATVEAENCFRAGLAVARAQEAKWWELRTTVSLARLLRDTNRGDEARSTLAEIYGGFTEGFDMSDLKEAKALLEELAS
jgi:class 3 adenylate cyclase/predicted ATPase